MPRKNASALAVAAALLTLAVPATTTAHDTQRGAVYTETNAATGNAVLAFERNDDGSLRALGSYPTGGLGTGAGLGSEGSLVLSADGTLLIAVNAGSNDVSSFTVYDDGSLRLIGTAPAGGTEPISVTIHGRRAYVLDAGGSGAISGFTVGDDGRLQPLAGSTRPLSGNATGPAEVAFSPQGDALVVTEKNTNRIDTYAVNQDGLASAPVTTAAAGVTPFGFAFDRHGRFFVSEAFGGAAGASTVSSYAITGGAAAVIDPVVATTQTAACWVAVTGDGRTVYDTNAGSDDLSAFAVGRDGSLTLLRADAGSVGTGGHPTDLALSTGSRFLYVLDAGTHGISAFGRTDDGTLVTIDGLSGLPASGVGIAAR